MVPIFEPAEAPTMNSVAIVDGIMQAFRVAIKRNATVTLYQDWLVIRLADCYRGLQPWMGQN